MEGDE
jgi:hypothetical protein